MSLPCLLAMAPLKKDEIKMNYNNEIGMINENEEVCFGQSLENIVDASNIKDDLFDANKNNDIIYVNSNLKYKILLDKSKNNGIGVINFPADKSIKSPREALIDIIRLAVIELTEQETVDGDLIDFRSIQDRLFDNKAIKDAVDKLMALKGVVNYQTARGRAALNVMDWINENIVAPGYLTKTELRLIPVSCFKEFDQRLYQALFDQRRSNSR